MTNKTIKQMIRESIEKILKEEPMAGMGAVAKSLDRLDDPTANEVEPTSLEEFAKGLVDIIRTNLPEVERINQLITYDATHSGKFGIVNSNIEEGKPDFLNSDEDESTSGDGKSEKAGCSGCENPKCTCNKEEVEEGTELAKPSKLPKKKRTGVSSGERGEIEVKDVVVKEDSKIQTPEQENKLYESRFTPRNNRIFEKLLKEWTK